MSRDVSAGPLAQPFANSLAPLTHLLAPSYSLQPRTRLRLFVCSFAHSRAHGKVNDQMSQNDLILSHSGMTTKFRLLVICCHMREQNIRTSVKHHLLELTLQMQRMGLGCRVDKDAEGVVFRGNRICLCERQL